MATPTSAAAAPAAAAPGSRKRRYTLADLEGVAQPWDDTRYEIIDGLTTKRAPPLGGRSTSVRPPRCFTICGLMT